MNRHLVNLLITSVIILFISACAPISPSEPEPLDSQPAISPTSTEMVVTPTASYTPIPTQAPTLPLSALEGPVLLIQTGFYEYHYLSPKIQVHIPVELPITDPQFRLGANLSPSGDLMFFPQGDDNGLILDIRTGEVVHTYDFSSPALFDPAQAVIEAQPLMTDLDLTEAALLDAVKQAHQSSIEQLRWFRDDGYHLSVHDSSETSTALFLDDHHTGVRLQLENEPGFVAEFRVGPDRNQILLKKAMVFQPGAFRDDSYYIINLEDQTTQAVQLPEDVQNPSVAWFSEHTLSVIHQTFMVGGTGYSLIDTRTMEASQIIPGEFSSLRRVGSHLFVIRQDHQTAQTTFELLTFEGEPIASQIIESRCFFQYAVLNHIIIQCDLESIVLDQELIIAPFFDSILSLTPAPDGSMFVMINRSDDSFLLDPNLNVQYELPLTETPVEIRWLPDSSGFLYRTHGRLYYYDVTSQSSHLLFESDIFSDYININAVWINME